MEYVILDAYQKAKRQQTAADGPLVNYVKEIYAPFTDEEISVKMVELLTPAGTQAQSRDRLPDFGGLACLLSGASG